MKMMEMRLTQKILEHWKEDLNIDQELQDVWQPWLQGPKGVHQCYLQIPRLANLGEDIGKEAERKEGIRLKAIPTLEHGVCPYCLKVHHRGEVGLKTVIHGGGEEVDGDGPTT